MRSCHQGLVKRCLIYKEINYVLLTKQFSMKKDLWWKPNLDLSTYCRRESDKNIQRSHLPGLLSQFPTSTKYRGIQFPTSTKYRGIHDDNQDTDKKHTQLREGLLESHKVQEYKQYLNDKSAHLTRNIPCWFQIQILVYTPTLRCDTWLYTGHYSRTK